MSATAPSGLLATSPALNPFLTHRLHEFQVPAQALRTQQLPQIDPARGQIALHSLCLENSPPVLASIGSIRIPLHPERAVPPTEMENKQPCPEAEVSHRP